MGILDIFKKTSETVTPKITADYGRLQGSYSVSFDGEKNAGEIGPAIDYTLDYNLLRVRSWQSYLENEITSTIIDRYTIWIIDKGLKLQCEPSSIILEAEKIKLDTEVFNSITEARFNLFAKSKTSSFSGMDNLNQISKAVFKGSKIGGDELVILRYVNNKVKVEHIDGGKIYSPILPFNVVNGNKITNGIEMDSKGRHVAYHIPGKIGEKSQIVKAWSEVTGLRMAFIIYGSKFRQGSERGMPIITTSLETLSKIDRYKEASVSGAEERQKIALFIEHDINSDGENPYTDNLAGAFSGDTSQTVNATTDDGKVLANTVASTTSKQVFNMTQGSRIKSISSDQELFFKEFYDTNANIICGNLGIPPNIAWSLYNDSFSASRTATKDWEHTMEVERNDFQIQFYEPIFALWFYTEVLKGKIKAPGFIEAFKNNDSDITESYTNVRYTGPMFPHIDPLKEAKAERIKLGTQFDSVPLTTLERATEILGSGDSISNVNQSAKELSRAESLGFKTEETEVEIKTSESPDKSK